MRKNKALAALVKNVAEESDVDALSVVDQRGRTLAGVGEKSALQSLARIAKKIAEDEPCPELEDETAGTDVMARAIDVGSRRVYLAALGRRVRRMIHAGDEVARILRAS